MDGYGYGRAIGCMFYACVVAGVVLGGAVVAAIWLAVSLLSRSL